MPDTQALAERAAAAMFARDHVAQNLGMVVEEVRPGYARLRMIVTQTMLNGHGTLHGGYSFIFADTAFAYACNSHNQVTVAAGCNIVYPAAGRLGDQLTAHAVETHLTGRNGVYDVTISNQEGTVIALFRGQSRQIGGLVAGD